MYRLKIILSVAGYVIISYMASIFLQSSGNKVLKLIAQGNAAIALLLFVFVLWLLTIVTPEKEPEKTIENIEES